MINQIIIITETIIIYQTMIKARLKKRAILFFFCVA